MIRGCIGLLSALVLAACGNSQAAPPGEKKSSSAQLRRAGAAPLCVTLGDVDVAGEGARVTASKMRGVVPGSQGDSAALEFVFRGSTEKTSRLASGQVRRQLGLKLRAADGCNLVYAMWRLSPGEPKVEVSVKRNPGDTTHAGCGAGGYTKIRPDESVSPPSLEVGASHRFQAAIRGDTLTVSIDDTEVWRGDIGAAADGLQGPAGVRTDNVALEAVRLSADPSQRSPNERTQSCASL